MATINQIPDSLSLLRNLKPLIATSSSPIVLTLVKDETTLIEETYHPDPSGKIEVDLRELVAPHLKTVLPTADIYEQASGSAVFVKPMCSFKKVTRWRTLSTPCFCNFSAEGVMAFSMCSMLVS